MKKDPGGSCSLFFAKLAGGEPAKGEGQNSNEKLDDGECGPVRIQQDRDRAGDDKADNGPVRLHFEAGEQPFDQLGDGEDANDDSQAKWDQDAKALQQATQIKMNERVDRRVDCRQDRFVIAKAHEHHAAAHARNDHGRGRDDADKKQQHHVDDAKA